MTAPAKHLTIRNVPAAIMRALDRERRRRATSLNQAAIDSLGKALGVTPEGVSQNGLVSLAGTWDEAELRAFERNTQPFEQVDDDLWK